MGNFKEIIMDDKLQHINDLFDICIKAEEQFINDTQDSMLKAKTIDTIEILLTLKQSINREYGK